MPYIDIISPDAYGQYNRPLAKIFGLQTAVYLSEIMDISTQVFKKEKYTEEGFWKLDRKYLTDRTTLTSQQQKEIEDMLEQLEIMSRQGKNQVRFRLDKIFAIISGEVQITEEQLAKAQPKTTAPKLTKREVILSALKKSILEEDLELRAAYENWLDVVYDKGVCSKIQIQSFINDINNYTADKNRKLEIIKIATQAGYKVAEWCFSKAGGNTATRATLPVQKVSDGNINREESF